MLRKHCLLSFCICFSFLTAVFSPPVFAGTTGIVPGFGNGAAILYPGAPFRASAIQNDGKVLATASANGSFITIRYNSNGTPDSSFNKTGVALTSFPGAGAASFAIAVQNNGKIVLAGIVGKGDGFSYYIAIARLNADGSIDSGFGNNGKIIGGNFYTPSIDMSIAFQSDQKILVGDAFGIERFNTDGSRDMTFVQSLNNIKSIAVQSDDKILVLQSDSNFTVSRFNPNGTPDNSFNGNGKNVTDFGGYDIAYSMAVQSDGKVVVIGSTRPPLEISPIQLVLARYNTDGSLDNSFDGDGKVITDLGNNASFNTNPAYTVAIQNDGKLVVTGRGILARYLTNGSIDQSFYQNGKLLLDAGVNIFSTLIRQNIIYLTGELKDSNGSPNGYFTAMTLDDTGAQTGLNFRYFGGNWNALPDFFAVPVIKTGLTPNVNLNVVPAGITDHFALVWEGFINIQVPGTYTFETVSDDGSMMFFNMFYNFDSNPLVNNDGIHAARSISKTVNITAPGKYPIAVTYFEKEGGQTMEFYWSGPGFVRQQVPSSVLSPKTLNIDSIPPGTPANLRVIATGDNFVSLAWDSATDNSGSVFYNIFINGVLQYYPPLENHYIVTGLNANTTYTFAVKASDFTGNRSAFSNQVTATTTSTVKRGLRYRFLTNVPVGNGIEGLTPYATGITHNADINERPAGFNTNYAFIWEGYIHIPTPGTYTFETVSDDGSRIFFNSTYSLFYTPLVDNFSNNGEHAVLSATGTIEIPVAGYYPIAISYQQYTGAQSMQLLWQGPGISRQPIPDDAFTYEPPQPTPLAGLKFTYYEGAWSRLPDFNALYVYRSGIVFKPDLSIKLPYRTDNFGILWEGFITIPTAGMYTFETVSDDGSKLYFNAQYDPLAQATVNNDGLHGPASATGTVNVPAAGRYPIAISFFERDGGEKMEVYWSGPGIPRQLIPASAFTQEPPPPPAQGLNFKYYEGAWSSLPNFNTLTPVKTYRSANVDISLRTRNRNDYFAFLWEGTITIPTAGVYTFETISDDGSKLYFNSLYNPAATATVNNDGIHAPTSATGIVNITSAGVYPITISYFEREGGEKMEVYWTGPGIPRQRIPDIAFAGSISGLQNALPLLNQTLNAEDVLKQVSVYPNPFDRNIVVNFNNNTPANNIAVGIYDVNGRLVYNYQAGKLQAGNNMLRIDVNNLPMTNGIYMVRLQVNGITGKTYKLMRLKR